MIMMIYVWRWDLSGSGGRCARTRGRCCRHRRRRRRRHYVLPTMDESGEDAKGPKAPEPEKVMKKRSD